MSRAEQVLEDEDWFIRRIRRLEGGGVHTRRDADSVSVRMLVTATTCAVAVMAGAIWTTSRAQAMAAPAAAPALVWDDIASFLRHLHLAN